jgi:hypothetical protein
MTKPLIKLIDSSLLPAAVLIVGKVIGIYFVAKVFNLSWTLESAPDSLFSISPLFDDKDLMTVSSYSDLFMYSLVLIGLSFSLFRAVFLHASHIDPKFVAKLATNNLLSLIKDSFDVYFEGTMWLVFTWVATFTIFTNILLNKTYIWVGLIAFAASFAFSIMLFKDVVKEIEVSRKKLRTPDFNLLK